MSERINPARESRGILATHMKRFCFIEELCKDKKVLDAGCGMGYGSHYLSNVAAEVIGVDIGKEAIEFAKSNYSKKNLKYCVGDVQNLSLRDSYFDVVCSFEIIEHVNQPKHYLKEITRVLKSDGLFVVSTPQVPKTDYAPQNPHHRIEYSQKDFRCLLTQYFDDIEMYGQRRKQSPLHYGIVRALDFLKIRQKIPQWTPLRKSVNVCLRTTGFHDMDLSDIMISKDKIGRATELVAICRTPRKYFQRS